MTIQHGAHASTLTVAGRQVSVRRSFALICRIEERFGPLREFGERLEACRFTAAEFRDLYRAVLADVQPAFSDEEIEGHIMASGVVRMVAELHPLVTAFFFGEERFMKRVADKAGGENPHPAPAS